MKASQIPLYLIQASDGSQVSYAVIDSKINWVSNKNNATLFKSKVLAHGWALKAKMMFRTYKLSVVNL